MDHEYGQQAAESYVRRGKRQTAAFVTADILAMGFIKGLMEHNVRVPEEMSIVGFDDVYLAQMCYPSLNHGESGYCAQGAAGGAMHSGYGGESRHRAH